MQVQIKSERKVRSNGVTSYESAVYIDGRKLPAAVQASFELTAKGPKVTLGFMPETLNVLVDEPGESGPVVPPGEPEEEPWT